MGLLEFLCEWLLLPIGFALVAVAGHEHISMARRSARNRCGNAVPTIEQARTFEITTMRGRNVLALPPDTQRVTQVFVRLPGLYDIALMPVAYDADITQLSLACRQGRPAWYRVVRDDGYVAVQLWPVPNDEYALCICIMAEAAVPLFAYDEYKPRDKAFKLLQDWLTPVQRKALAETSCFVVKGNVTGNLYRITTGMVFNVEELDSNNGLPARKLCLVPDNAAFPGDIMLAQKIMLETDEMRALAIANKQSRPMAYADPTLQHLNVDFPA